MSVSRFLDVQVLTSVVQSLSAQSSQHQGARAVSPVTASVSPPLLEAPVLTKLSYLCHPLNQRLSQHHDTS